MNIKFELDEAQNTLDLIVTLPKRRKVSDKRVRVGLKTARQLLKENYKCPPDLQVLECLTPGSSADNAYGHKRVGVWKFKVHKQTKQKPVPRTTNKTSRPKISSVGAPDLVAPGPARATRASRKTKKRDK